MKILRPAYSYGSSSSSSSVAVDSDKIFDTEEDRDQYFTDNPSELVEGVYVSSDSKLMMYRSGAWVEIGETIRGEKGDSGSNGASFYPQYSADNLTFHNAFDAANDKYIRIVTIDSSGNLSYSDGVQWISDDEGSTLDTDQLAKVNAIEEVFTSTEKTSLATVIAQTHVHSNITILDNTTAAFTLAYEAKLANITDRFKGIFADSIARDLAILTPSNGDYCKQSDTDSFWFYGTTWVDSGSTSTGDMMASIYDPQNIADDAFDRSNHTGTQDQSTINGLEAALDDKQDASTVLENTTESFTSELLQRIVDLENSSSSGSTSATQIVHFGTNTRRSVGSNLTADFIAPESTMLVAANGLFTAPYDGLYRIDVNLQGGNNNSTRVNSAIYWVGTSINDGEDEALGITELQFERTNFTLTDLSCSTFGLRQLSAGDTLLLTSYPTDSNTSYIHRCQVMIEYKG